MTPPDELLTASEIAGRLRLKPATVRAWVARHELVSKGARRAAGKTALALVGVYSLAAATKLAAAYLARKRA